ncbi:MAG: 1,4-dihydroxy-2-naphthoate polyprenyltransferase [Chloroflexota bacterium]|nr:1,4-dihydroxy-2-naphthoate polyprenyltransferase [Chloroflexota bacterium]
MIETASRHPLRAWMLAARVRTLPAAAAPVVVGTGAAIGMGAFRFFPALAALVGALLLQIGANFANDLFDFLRGADTAARVGPLRVTQAGLLTPRQVRAGMCVVFGAAALIGVYLIVTGGWPIVLIGLAAILAAIAYTGGPFPLGYHGLGELFVFLFFGLAAVGGTYEVQASAIHAVAWWAAIPMGLLAVAIIVVNNLRDIVTDRAAGKRTLAVRFGERGTQAEYIALLVIAYLIPPLMWITGVVVSAWVLLALLSLPLAPSLVRRLRRERGRALNGVLAGTARLELVYGLLFALGLALGA